MNPYQTLGAQAYWKSAVAGPGPDAISGLWTPKFQILPTDKIVTAGSCFAQHIGKALSARGYGWTDFEPAPPYLSATEAAQFGYGVFSFRTGNIYTPKMLLQWLKLAFHKGAAPGELWEQDGRWFDPLRPVIEPNGFVSRDELLEARQATFGALRKAVRDADVFVFTLGLTECWRNTSSGLEYAMCPGTAAGRFDQIQHKFRNGTIRSVHWALSKALDFLHARNPTIKVLLTVSPVPLTATASGKHVLTATSYSKSVLRACAGLAADEHEWVDYFPSFEIITHPVFQGQFFAKNLRSVTPKGVDTVMGHFFADQEAQFGPVDKHVSTEDGPAVHADDIRCEEEMLNAFSR
jgi:hypothetical protein